MTEHIQKPRTPILENDPSDVIDHIDGTPGNPHLRDLLLRSYHDAAEAEYESLARFIDSHLNVSEAFVESMSGVAEATDSDHDLGIVVFHGDEVTPEGVLEFIADKNLPLIELEWDYDDRVLLY